MILFIFRSKKRKEYSIERIFEGLDRWYSENGIETRRIYLPEERYNAIRKLYNNVKYVKQNSSDIYHITGEVYFLASFLPKKKTIMTIHDLGERFLAGSGSIKRVLFKYMWYYFPIRHSKIVTCISEKTRDEVVECFPWARNKLIVIPDPYDPRFKASDKAFDYACPKILLVGTRSNKNIERVIKAVKDISCQLVIIGNLSDEQKQLLIAEKTNYINEHDLSDAEIIRKYVEADIVCFPSTYEGFGMPIIEAQVVGRPVITSNLRPMSDICGEGALLVNPYDIANIKKAIADVIKDKQLRSRLIEAGYQNAKKYRIEVIAQEYLKQYEKISKKKTSEKN